MLKPKTLFAFTGMFVIVFTIGMIGIKVITPREDAEHTHDLIISVGEGPCTIDIDGDGFTAAHCGGPDCDDDGDGHLADIPVCAGDDCHDEFAFIRPGAPLDCTHGPADNDCNGVDDKYEPECNQPSPVENIDVSKLRPVTLYTCIGTSPDGSRVALSVTNDDPLYAEFAAMPDVHCKALGGVMKR